MPAKRQRVHVEDREACKILQSIIYNQIVELNFRQKKNLIILCIGTDRSTGDSLGPLIGTFLERGKYLPAEIYGKIENPVHASNLDQVINEIEQTFPSPFIIAIDAGLGKQSSVGCIDVKKGPLKPGTGVNKKLTKVGDMHITGLVNIGGYMEYLVLQSTRLSLVIKMAEIIATSLQSTLSTLFQEKSAVD